VVLRRSSPPSLFSDLSHAIPVARQPAAGSTRLSSPLAPVLGHRSAIAPANSSLRLRHFLNVAEGSLLLVAVYMLIGAGIGDAAGSVMVGVAAGLIAGVCAIAAILLISGSALTARAAAERGPRGVSQAR
jgi:hypothetical protein